MATKLPDISLSGSTRVRLETYCQGCQRKPGLKEGFAMAGDGEASQDLHCRCQWHGNWWRCQCCSGLARLCLLAPVGQFLGCTHGEAFLNVTCRPCRYMSARTAVKPCSFLCREPLIPGSCSKGAAASAVLHSKHGKTGFSLTRCHSRVSTEQSSPSSPQNSPSRPGTPFSQFGLVLLSGRTPYFATLLANWASHPNLARQCCCL